MSYIKGKDLLFQVGGKCIGHCTEHTITYSTGTTDIAVKPPASEAPSSSNFKEKLIDSQDIKISFKGLRATDEIENGFDEIAALWGAAKPVEAAAFKRTQDTKPHFKGMCVIDSLVETNGADGIAEYNGEMTVTGTPEIYPGKTLAELEQGKDQGAE